MLAAEALDRRPDEAGFRAEARAWLAARLEPRPAGEAGWGGDLGDSTAVFPDLYGEAELVESRREWEAKYDGGWGAVLTWPEQVGGRGLPGRFEVVFNEEEAAFRTPPGSEIFSVTQHLVAPTLDQWGRPETKDELLRSLLRTNVLGAPAFRIAGGTDEIQRTIIGERVLGLPPEPKPTASGSPAGARAG